jgi:hypothetical protein
METRRDVIYIDCGHVKWLGTDNTNKSACNIQPTKDGIAKQAHASVLMGGGSRRMQTPSRRDFSRL